MPSSASPVRVQAPATVGNFGPGFDAFALALHGLGDRVELRPADEDIVTVAGIDAESVPTAWHRNVAAVALDAVRRRVGSKERFELRIRKGRPPGSGLGSSASSAGGAVLAFHATRAGHALTPEELVLSAGDGEAAAAGRHYDDVAAVVLGGLAIVRPRNGGLLLSRVAPPRNLHLAILQPHLVLRTRDMRRILPARIPRADATHNLANAAALIHAFHEGDVEAVGDCLEDRIATPTRKSRVPFFDDVHVAALGAGAFGVALSGSGPAMVAVCASRRNASRIATAMHAAVESHKIPAEAFAAEPEREVMHRAVAMH